MSFRSLLCTCASAAVMAVTTSHPSSAGTLLSPAQLDAVTAGTAGNETIISSIIVGDLDLSSNKILSHDTPAVRVHVERNGEQARLLVSVDDTTVNIQDILDGNLTHTLSGIRLDDAVSISFTDATDVSTVMSTLSDSIVVTTREFQTTSGSKHTVVVRSDIESFGATATQSVLQSIQQSIQ